ncbi:MAG: DsbA family protein [Bacteroidota bacterium]
MAKVNGRAHYDKEEPEVLYVYDALCGWCFGFNDVIKKLKEAYGNKVSFLVLSGGMVRGEEITPICQMADFIRHAYPQVEITTGVKFGKEFLNGLLDREDVLLTSIPPAKAMAVFRIEKRGECVEFAARIQQAFYYEGMRMDEPQTWHTLADEFGLDPEKFVQRMESDEIARIIDNEFRMIKGMGVNGFPSVVLRKGEKMHILTRGFCDYNTLSQALDQALKS